MKSGALCKYIFGGWPSQILGAIRAMVTATEPGQILFIFGQVGNAKFRRFSNGTLESSEGEKFRITRQVVP